MKLAIGILAVSALSAQVTAVVSSQGADVIKTTTGYTPKNATLARVDVCSAGDADVNVSTSRVVASVIVQGQYGVYGSDVVAAVLASLQQRDVFYRAQKAITAGRNTVVLLTAIFKTLTPLTAAIVQAAPDIAAAVLPAAGDPRDLAALSAKIMPDNGALVLGKKGSGNDCHTGLIVAMAPSIAITSVNVQ